VRRHPVAQMVVVGVIASAIGVALALAIDWFPTDAAAQASDIDTLYDVLLIASVPVFVGVTTVVLYCVVKFRMRPGQENEDGPPIHGNTRLEVIWTALPALLLVGLCTYAYTVLRDVEEKGANEMVVRVTGQQFAWRFSYPQPEGGRVATSTILVLPEDRPILFKVTSDDVIHDFWVPAFRMKIDAVPGLTTEVRATPSKRGRFPVVCAELCGLGHATMRATAWVVSPAAFERWLDRARSEPTTGSSGEGGPGAGASEGGPTTDEDADDAAAAGRTTFVATCGGCHQLADAGTSGSVGPSLDDTLRGQSQDEIREDIVDPDARVAEGYEPGVMPSNFEETLSAEQIDGLVAYLESVSR